MFTLTLHDCNGTQLNLGDVVRISSGRTWAFYAEVKYLPEEQLITPFHTFSFMSVEKVDEVPANAIRSAEERYGIWHLPTNDPDGGADAFNRYLIEWRQCESLLAKRIFRIQPIGGQTSLF